MPVEVYVHAVKLQWLASLNISLWFVETVFWEPCSILSSYNSDAAHPAFMIRLTEITRWDFGLQFLWDYQWVSTVRTRRAAAYPILWLHPRTLQPTPTHIWKSYKLTCTSPWNFLMSWAKISLLFLSDIKLLADLSSIGSPCFLFYPWTTLSFRNFLTKTPQLECQRTSKIKCKQGISKNKWACWNWPQT
jgi:hypothetical protein